MNTFLKNFTDLKIDPTQLVIDNLGGGSLGNNFELSPKDFIRFAKEDFKTDSTRGLINAITNAKRAIDCQIDNALTGFGLAMDNIDKSSEFLIKDLNLNQKNLPFKLKLIQALGLAPGGLTSKVRNLRNKLEHYYKIPKNQEVEEAIEIAELFILSIESKTKILDDHFIISSKNFERLDSMELHKSGTYNFMEPQLYQTQLRVNFCTNKKKIEIIPTKENKQKRKIIYKCDNSVYYYLIRLINHLDEKNDSEDDIKLLLKHCNHPIPVNNIKLSEFC